LHQQHINDLHIPEPDVNLGVNQGSSTENTALMMLGIEKVLRSWTPDLVLVYGDTDSTLAGALTAKKLRIKLAHIEAGARSGDNRMIEEGNRIIVDSIADLLLYVSKCTGHTPAQSWQSGAFVGDLMLDSLNRHKHLWTWREYEEYQYDKDITLRKQEYYYMTLHRAETVDNKESLRTVLNAVGNHLDYPVYLSVHPRLKAKLNLFGLSMPAGITCIEPQPYAINLKLMAGAKKVLTDSGGMQKEAFWLRTPCITLRDSTEWPETLNFDHNILTGIDKERIRQALKMKQALTPGQDPAMIFGNGLAGSTVLSVIKSFLKAVGV
jgi:UDP-GlcNAc3NAcA epimerase